MVSRGWEGEAWGLAVTIIRMILNRGLATYLASRPDVASLVSAIYRAGGSKRGLGVARGLLVLRLEAGRLEPAHDK